MGIEATGNVTIIDLAKALGLSVSTVSRALNDKPDISAKTKKLVNDTAETLGYVQNRVAASLRQKNTASIGVIIPEIDNLYFSEIVAGIEKVARKNNYDIILSSTNESIKREHEVTKFLIEKRVDGIIAMPVKSDSKSIDLIKRNRIPYVYVARRIDQDDKASYVVNDDEMGGYMATRHLLEKGHKKILFLNGIKGNYSALSQLAGYKRALSEFKIEFSNSLNIMNNINVKDGYDNIKVQFRQRNDITGIICFSDMIALGASKAIKEFNRRIPEDTAIVGCDNISFVEYFDTPLTTVDLAKSKLGEKAMEILMRNILGVDKGNHQIVFEPTLIVRSST